MAFVDSFQASGSGSFARRVAPAKPTEAIVGGGLAGLIEAYKLTQAGYHVDLYESSPTPGGRVKNIENPFGDGGHFDLAGEIIDQKHTDMIALCSELGVPLIDRHLAIPGDGLMTAGGKTYHDSDMLDPKTGTGDFAKLADAIRRDQIVLRDDKGGWTPAAEALDHLSIDQYLERKAAETGTPRHVVDILKTAYTSEIGRDTTELSALNLIDFIGADKHQDFAIYGDSDETFVVKGGTAALVQALMKKLDGKATLHFGEKLEEIQDGGAVGHTLVFSKDGQTQPPIHYDHVDFGLPLPVLSHVKGIENLGIPAETLDRMRSAQYNQYTKIMVQTKGRPWQAIPGFNGEVTAAGSGFQAAWPSNDETNPESRAPNGTVTFLVGGAQAMKPAAEIVESAKRDYAAFLGKPVEEIFTPAQPVVMQHGKTGGCLPAPAVGGYIALDKLSRELQAVPGVGFAGSYITTPSENGTWVGFMHNAGTSAGQAAEKTIGELKQIEQGKTQLLSSQAQGVKFG